MKSSIIFEAMHRLRFLCVAFLLVGFAGANQAFAQKRIQVTSSEDGVGIPSAHIQYSTQKDGKERTLICDKLGIAQIPISAVGGLYVKIYHIGYAPYQAHFTNDDPVRIELKAKAEYLGEAIVTQQYSKRSVNKAVEKVNIINSKQIQNMAAVNLGDALQTQLAIGINQDNATGTMVSMMGISGNNVKILIDGVPMIGRLDGNLDLSQINLNDIERVEVVEGPMSVSYGTNALAGVINLITKKSSRNKKSLSLNAYSEFGARYNFDFTGRAAIKQTGLKLSGGRNFFSGWPAEDATRFQQWKPKEQYFGRIELNRAFDKTSLRLKSEGFREIIQDKGLPTAPYNETAFDQYFTTVRWDESLFVNHKLNKNNALDMIFAYNYYSRDRVKFFKDLVTLNETKTLTPSDHDTSTFTNFVARGTWSQFGKSLRSSFQLGYDLNFQNGTGSRILNQKQGFTDLAVFGSMEIKPWSNMVIKPGLRLAYNSNYKAPPTPMISIRQKLQHFTIRGSYSRGFRAPELKELYLNFVDVNHNIVGNPDLEAEYSHNYIFSVLKAFYSPKVIFKPELSGFYNAINNKINLANTSGTEYTYVNIDNFKSLGSKLNFQVRTEGIKANVGLAAIGISDPQAVNTLIDGYSFYNEVTTNIQWQIKKFLLNVFYKYNGAQTNFIVGDENEILTRQMEAYHTLDVNLGSNFLENNLSVFIGAKNLMDNTNLNAAVQNSGSHSGGSSVPIGIGRTFFLKVNYNLSFK